MMKNHEIQGYYIGNKKKEKITFYEPKGLTNSINKNALSIGVLGKGKAFNQSFSKGVLKEERH